MGDFEGPPDGEGLTFDEQAEKLAGRWTEEQIRSALGALHAVLVQVSRMGGQESPLRTGSTATRGSATCSGPTCGRREAQRRATRQPLTWCAFSLRAGSTSAGTWSTLFHGASTGG